MARHKIESYRFGNIVVDGTTYTDDLIILPERIVSGWWREKGHTLLSEDLDAIFDARPDLLIVGQGANGRMSVPAATRSALEDAGIEVVALKTADAVDRYNQAQEGSRTVAAALHLTC